MPRLSTPRWPSSYPSVHVTAPASARIRQLVVAPRTFSLLVLTWLTGSVAPEPLAHASAKPLAICARDSADAKAATAALADLDQRVARLTSAADAAATAKV